MVTVKYTAKPVQQVAGMIAAENVVKPLKRPINISAELHGDNWLYAKPTVSGSPCQWVCVYHQKQCLTH